ncbi:MAG: HAD-IIB family hydrolase [Clostridia bacterium]|nr:HAD-IIB family hydrolase [Clostridia bacterium]
MKYRLVISDFDGTLGTAPDIIEEDTVNAIKSYVERGGIFAVCTGRMLSGIRPICLKYGIKGVVASNQGAMINDIETGESLFSGGIGIKDAEDILGDILDLGYTAVAEIDDVMYYQHKTSYVDLYEYCSKIKGKEVTDIIAFVKENGRAVNKVLGFCDPEKTEESVKTLAEKYKGKLFVNSGAPFLVEAVSVWCGKRFAVNFLADYYKVPHEKVMTVGDSTNDIELLSGDWHGVAVGDGAEELKSAAREITVPYKDKPVKFLLEKYCL